MVNLEPQQRRRLTRIFQRIRSNARADAEAVAREFTSTISGPGGELSSLLLDGDVVGPLLTNLLMKIRGTPVSGIPPLDGQVLVYNEAADQWEPGAPGGDSGEIINYGSLTNEALTSRGATFSATSSSSGHAPGSAADENDMTFWQTLGSASPSDPADGAWWKADLSSAKTISWFRVAQASSSQFRATSYKLQSSTDNSTWTDQVTFGAVGDSGIEELPVPITARYWRVLGVEMDPLPAFTNYWGLATVALYSGAPTTLGSGHIIQDDGLPLTQRTVLNFTGVGITAADTDGKTTVTITYAEPVLEGGDGGATDPDFVFDGVDIVMEWV